MADLGNKHECLNCGTKFYDLGRSQLVCPSCGGDQEELSKEQTADEQSSAGKASKGKVKTKAKKAAKKPKKKKKSAGPKKEPQSTKE